jgi:signal transduction histidine kinase
VVEFYQPLAKFKGNTLDLNFSESDIRVSCDPQKIETVMSNLLSNAIKFTMNGIIRIQLAPNQHDVTVSVEDSGSGIAQKELEHIFKPFYQGKEGKNTKGAGIGLAIAKAWVEAHGGHIWAESDGEGKGTKVTFSLPLG